MNYFPLVVKEDRNILLTAEEICITQYEHNVTTLTFTCPRYLFGEDISKMLAYIQFTRKDGFRGDVLAQEFRVSSEDDSLVTFKWVITRTVTEVAGAVSFLVNIKDVDEKGVETLYWGSFTSNCLKVKRGIRPVPPISSEDYPDIIALLAKSKLNNSGYAPNKFLGTDEDGYVITIEPLVIEGIDGVGVESIEQTLTSEEDDGINEITVTLTNGEKHSFNIKNGSKGSKGDDGVSIKSVNFNEDYSLTITLTDDSEHTTKSLRGTDGKDGREIELKTDGTLIQWRYVDEILWKDLYEIDLSSLKGDRGVSIQSVKQTALSEEDNGVNELTITLDDGATTTFSVRNGSKGDKGDAGTGISEVRVNSDGSLTLVLTNGTSFTTPSLKGEDGAEGTTPHIGDNGNWFIGDVDTNVLARGDIGKDGVGIKDFKFNDDNTLTITLTDETSFTTPVLKGADGYTPQKDVDYFDGKDGKSAYDYALEGGYKGTEEEFALKLAGELSSCKCNHSEITVSMLESWYSELDSGEGDDSGGTEGDEVIDTITDEEIDEMYDSDIEYSGGSLTKEEIEQMYNEDITYAEDVGVPNEEISKDYSD